MKMKKVRLGSPSKTSQQWQQGRGARPGPSDCLESCCVCLSGFCIIDTCMSPASRWLPLSMTQGASLKSTCKQVRGTTQWFLTVLFYHYATLRTATPAVCTSKNISSPFSLLLFGAYPSLMGLLPHFPRTILLASFSFNSIYIYTTHFDT